MKKNPVQVMLGELTEMRELLTEIDKLPSRDILVRQAAKEVKNARLAVAALYQVFFLKSLEQNKKGRAMKQ